MSNALHFGINLPERIMDDHLSVCHQLLMKDEWVDPLSRYDRLLLFESDILFKISTGNFVGAENRCRSVFTYPDAPSHQQNVTRMHCHLAKALHLRGKKNEAEMITGTIAAAEFAKEGLLKK